MPVVPAPAAPTHTLPGVSFTSLATPSRCSTESTAVWTVEIAPGIPATTHEVTREEVFVVLSGRARARIGGVEQFADPGDAIVVPPHTPFELDAAGSEPMRAVCCLPVGGQARMAGGEPFTPPWAR
jgi:mannose-6-phosphate isomerase-like protein (cupin superfamily)